VAKNVLTEFRLELSSFLSLVFGFLTLVSVVGVFFTDKLPTWLSSLQDLSDPFGNWSYWIVVIGPLGLVVCIWWLYDYVKKTRELAKLIDTPSRAKFVRNIDDIEYLAWSLPQRFEDRVLAKKKEFGL
jgi:magnesium-transporting ATPase (P-type)